MFSAMMSIELRNTLSNSVSSRLGATLVFDHPSVRSLATHLGNTVFPELFTPDPPDNQAEDLEALDAESLSALLAAELGEDVRRG